MMNQSWAAAPRTGIQTATRVDSPGRSVALDFTKGSLVVLMVVYHWLNYFVVPTWDVYRFLRFLTPSFIFISGFIVTNVYGRRYESASAEVRRRLSTRGLKLLVLFGGLNVLSAALSGRRAIEALLSKSNIAAVFLTGDGHAAFDVLVPIAYLLILSPLMLEAKRRVPYSPRPIAAAVVVIATVMSMKGEAVATVELVALGCLGMAVGDTSVLTGEIRQPGLLVLLYIAYLAAISIWNVAFPLQVVGVTLSLCLLVAVGQRYARGPSLRWVLRLGNYSLLAYVAQIALMQLLQKVVAPGVPGWFQLALLALAMAGTIAAVSAVARARVGSRFCDRVYRFVFA